MLCKILIALYKRRNVGSRACNNRTNHAVVHYLKGAIRRQANTGFTNALKFKWYCSKNKIFIWKLQRLQRNPLCHNTVTIFLYNKPNPRQRLSLLYTGRLFHKAAWVSKKDRQNG